jgi:prepilin-type N-terminal cleavage/methylation domain-containing protein
MEQAVHDKNPHGLTLLELLIVIAVIAVLLGVIVPGIRGIRSRSREVEVLSTLKQHAATFTVYGGDYKGSTPQIVPAEVGEFDITPSGFSVPIVVRYPWTWGYWHFAFARKYYEQGVMSPAFYAPGEARGSVTNYQFSCAFLADAEFWDPTSRTGPLQWRAQRLDEVASTSSKVLLASDSPMPIDEQRRVVVGTATRGHFAWVDGSGSAVASSFILPGYSRGDGPWGEPYHQGESWPLGCHTLQGVRGRDRK